MATTDPFRLNLVMLLGDGHAHMGFEEAVRDFPTDRMNERPPNVPYSPWHLLEHMRLTQRDSLDYARDPNYTESRWPDDFWPPRDATADEAAWNATLDAFRADLAEFVAMVDDDAQDLVAPVPTNPEHNILRSIIVIAAHNHHHLGEFAILRQVMGTWPPDHDK